MSYQDFEDTFDDVPDIPDIEQIDPEPTKVESKESDPIPIEDLTSENLDIGYLNRAILWNSFNLATSLHYSIAELFDSTKSSRISEVSEHLKCIKILTRGLPI